VRTLTACILVGLLMTVPAWGQSEVPTLTGRVVDQAEVLSPTVERSLTALLAAHEDTTSNQVAILTVPTLDGVPVEQYALRVAETWQLGTATFDNGALILVAPADRAARIEVGTGLEGALPDVVASRILRHEMVPHFRSGDYEGGIEAGAVAVVGALEGTYTPPPVEATAAEQGDEFRALLGFILSGLLVIASAMLGMSTRGRARRWGLFAGLLIPYGLVGWLVGSGFGDMDIGIAVFISVLILHVIFFIMGSSRGKGAGGTSWSPSSGYSSSGGSSYSSYSSGSSYSSSSSFSGGGGSFSGGGASASW
jgi:uncharacterized protein